MENAHTCSISYHSNDRSDLLSTTINILSLVADFQSCFMCRTHASCSSSRKVVSKVSFCHTHSGHTSMELLALKSLSKYSKLNSTSNEAIPTASWISGLSTYCLMMHTFFFIIIASCEARVHTCTSNHN